MRVMMMMRVEREEGEVFHEMPTKKKETEKKADAQREREEKTPNQTGTSLKLNSLFLFPSPGILITG